MYTDEDLTAAVRDGILTDATAKAFRAYVERAKNAPAVDEEHFRLVTGFNDIFVTIACGLLLMSVRWLAEAVADWLGPLALSAVAWGLGEYFIRKRRMALPAIVLLLAFVGGILSSLLIAMPNNSTSIAIATAVATIAAWLHWIRNSRPDHCRCGRGCPGGLCRRGALFVDG